MNTLLETTDIYLKNKRKLASRSRDTYGFALNLFASRVDGKAAADLTHQVPSNFITFLDKDKYAKTTIKLTVS